MGDSLHFPGPHPSPDDEGRLLTVVGVGASAGGLKALQQFVEAIKPDSGMAYVVIVHLDPERESRMAELLQDRARIPVKQVSTAVQVEADHIYIIPPDQDLEMHGMTIGVLPRAGRAARAPVDHFFCTLAEAYGPAAVGVVLSGTGTDGTAGIRAIRERGGTTVAQSPDEAEFDGMPTSAIATGLIDLVLPSARIPGELARLRLMPSSLAVSETAEAEEPAGLSGVYAVLRGRTGHDFSQYKRSTILRRLDRRLRFNGLDTLDEYVPLLRASPTETEALLRDLLISVSAFFRDTEAFEALEKVVPRLYEGKGPGDVVRVWIVGCATGEEVYSVAMILAEYAASLDDPPRIQMFATDIDERGYAWGREGVYSAATVARVSPERLRRFFTKEPGGYRVTKSLREMVLFAVHNVLHDPPFARMDLISCRNLLIYLEPDAQEQVLETFHYALNRNGVLFLGESETAGTAGLFTPLAGSHRIYGRVAGARTGVPRLSRVDPKRPVGRRPGAAAAAAPESGPDPTFSYGDLHMSMLEQYVPPSVVVDERLDVVHLSSGAGRFLHLAEGNPSHRIMDLAQGELRLALRTSLHEAFVDDLQTTRQVLWGEAGAETRVNVHVRPPVEKGRDRYALIVFEEIPAEAPAAGADGAAPQRPGVIDLEEDLRRTRAQLETTSAAYDRTVADFQAVHEELLSINEEQKAAAEELETGREEIQSINEELTTINQEHRSTIEELKRTNGDLQNLIESTEIGTIFLDLAMRIRRFTPSAATLFNFVAADHGRPLVHITHRLDYPEMAADVGRVLETLTRIEREVTSDTGQSYIVRINPYRSLDGKADGAVLTFFDNTARHRIDAELRAAKAVAESANVAKGAFLATLSHEFRTPLNAILGYADLLPLDGDLSTAQQQKVERIKAAAWHLAAMIDEVLSFARLDGGHEVIQQTGVDACAIANEAKALMEPAAHAKGLTFVLESADAPVQLETDPGKARQVLINLCGNAVAYTESGEVRVAVREEDGRVVFEVRDTGIGISPEHQKLIFDRFWRVDGSSTRASGGMGIGLAAAREYARLLGGDVEVESEPGMGSTFRFWLPRSPNGDASRAGRRQ